MTQKLIASLKPLLPLLIDRAECRDPVLSIGGKDWSFNTTSTWRLVDTVKLIAGCEDEAACELINEIKGSSIIACEAMSVKPTIDPRFTLSNGLKLEIFSATAIEPWVFSLDGKITFVAYPTVDNP